MKSLWVSYLFVVVLFSLGCVNRTTPASTSVALALPTADATVEMEATERVQSAESTSPAPTSTQIIESAPPSDIPSNGRLLVIDPSNQLVTINPDGSDMRQLTDSQDGIAYIFPAWSPDNRSIAAIGSGQRSATDGVYIFEDVAESDGNRIHTSDEQQPIYLYWSPDSENVSFILPRSGGSTLLDLRIVPRDGSERSRYLAFGQPFYWDWNSAGDQIIINTKRTTHASFAYVDPVNGDISEEIGNASAFFQSPDFSHDDAYFAYSGGLNEVVIENRATGDVITTPHEGLTALAWSPVANQLAFINSVGATPLPYGAVHLFDPTGTESTLVADAVIAFFWSPDGTKIAYLTLSTQGADPEARRGRLSARSAERRFQTDRFEYQLWVVDVATAESQLLGAFRPGNLFIAQFIPFFDQYARSHSIWSPDSTALALPIETEDGVIVYRFPANGAPPTALTPGQAAFWTR